MFADHILAVGVDFCIFIDLIFYYKLMSERWVATLSFDLMPIMRETSLNFSGRLPNYVCSASQLHLLQMNAGYEQAEFYRILIVLTVVLPSFCFRVFTLRRKLKRNSLSGQILQKAYHGNHIYQ